MQVVVNAPLVCVCVECQSSHKQCSRSVEGSGCCLGPSLFRIRAGWIQKGSVLLWESIVMIVREICPPLVQMI